MNFLRKSYIPNTKYSNFLNNFWYYKYYLHYFRLVLLKFIFIRIITNVSFCYFINYQFYKHDHLPKVTYQNFLTSLITIYIDLVLLFK